MTLDRLVESNQAVLDFAEERTPKREAPVIEETPEAPFLPYKPRGCQLEIIHDMVTALDDGRHFVMESGTGTGKTIISLAAGLDHATRTGKTIVYLTRTISQSDQVMRELRSISKIKPVRGIAITGRSKSCPLFRGVRDYDNIPSNILSMMCEDAREKSIHGKAGGCRYFDRVDYALPQIQKYLETEFPTSDELDSFCVRLQACPYEAKKKLMKDAKVVAAPYVHILDPDIRESLMTNLDRPGDPQSLLIIVDEAHNLVDAARESETFRIERSMVDASIDECSTFRHQPIIWGDVPLNSFLTFLKACIRGVATDLIPMGSDTAVIEGPLIEERIMTKFGMKQADLDSAIETMLDIGEQRTDALMEKGENRISDIQSVASFLQSWCGTASERFVRTVKADKDGEYLRACCIDPDEISKFLNSTNGTVHMSGTLQPLDQYARVIGLSSKITFRKYPSPFPPENRKVVYTPDLTTRWQDLKNDPSMKTRLEKTIADLCNPYPEEAVLGGVPQRPAQRIEPRRIQIPARRSALLRHGREVRRRDRFPRRGAVLRHSGRDTVSSPIPGDEGHERYVRCQVRGREGMALLLRSPCAEEDEAGHRTSDQDRDGPRDGRDPRQPRFALRPRAGGREVRRPGRRCRALLLRK